MTTLAEETPPAPAEAPGAKPIPQGKDPISWVIRKFRKASGPMAAFPLGVLFFIYAADEFDTAIFGTLAPEIQKSFNLSDEGFTSIIAVNLVLIILLSIPLGWLSDTTVRVRLVWISAIVAVVFSFATGLATTVAILVIFRLGNGIGLLANDPVHTSLLADYYLPQHRPEVFSLHRTAPRVGAIAGPAVAGLIGFFLGWRAAFFIMTVPVAFMIYFALRMKEPVRGATDSPEQALEAALERPVSFGRSIRMLHSVKTLRRQFIAYVFVGAAFVPLVAFLALYLEEVFNVNEVGRGAVGTANAAGGMVGVLWAGRLTRDRWMKKGVGHLMKASGWVLIGVGIGLLVIAAVDVLWIVVVLGVIVTGIGALYFPPLLTATALVAPARVRSQAFTLALLYLAAGAIFTPIAGSISDDHGVRWGIAALTPWWILGGAVLWSAHRFVEGDTNRAMEILFTTAQLRQERLSASANSVLVCRNVDVSYGPVQVLFGVNLDMKEGELIALLGTNGAGKSTLLKAISGLVPTDRGAIFFEGEDITGMEPEDTFAAGVVQVPGGRGIFPGLTVEENLRVAAWGTRRPKSEIEPAIAEVYEIFPILKVRSKQQAAVLSGGEQQMLTLGQAFIARPKLLMIDELTLGLAPIIVEQLLQIVDAIHKEGTSVILVEQSVNLALTIAERAYFMEKGEIRFSGPTSELLERDDILRAVFLGGDRSLIGQPPGGSE